VKPLFVIGRDEIAAESSVSVPTLSKGLLSVSLFMSCSLETTFDEALDRLALGVLSSSLSGGKSSPGFVAKAFGLSAIAFDSVDSSAAFKAFSFRFFRYANFFSSKSPHNLKSTSRSTIRVSLSCRRL
jgi:hypothetical protein